MFLIIDLRKWTQETTAFPPVWVFVTAFTKIDDPRADVMKRKRPDEGSWNCRLGVENNPIPAVLPKRTGRKQGVEDP